MEKINENKELQSKKKYKALTILEKNDTFCRNKEHFPIPIPENSDLNTNNENSNSLKNQKLKNFEAAKSFSLSDKNLSENISQVKAIILNLRRSMEVNSQIQKALMQKYEKLSEKQITIEKTLEKIKRINKSKQKKHIKYLKYTPLNKVYYYCPKKIHYYYILMDLVIKSRKKNKQMLNGNFHFSLGGNNSNVSKKRDINRFKFSKREDAVLKKHLLFSAAAEGADWGEIARELQTKNAFQVFVRSLELSNFYAYKKWNNIEDNILRKAILYYGPKNWQQISYCLDGRNNSQCFHRWMKGINPKIKRNKWSFEEDLTLGVALKIYGNKKWSKIANHLNGRTDIQCRERFCNILDPNLEEVEWKSAEDIKLLSLYEKYGNKWSRIAKEFGNRTDNTCWRRWKYLISVKNFGTNFNCNSNGNCNVSNINKNLIGSNVNRIDNIDRGGLNAKGDFLDDKHKNKLLSVTNTNLSGSISNLVVNTPTTNNYSNLVNNRNNAVKKDKEINAHAKTSLNTKKNDDNKKSESKKKDKNSKNFDLQIKSERNLNNINSDLNDLDPYRQSDSKAQPNRNKLFATSNSKNISESNTHDFNRDTDNINLGLSREIYLNNKTELNDAKKNNDNNTDSKRSYLGKRPRNLSKDEVDLKKKKTKTDKTTQFLIRGELNLKSEEDESDVDGEMSLLESEETKSFSKKNNKKDSNKDKAIPISSSTRKKASRRCSKLDSKYNKKNKNKNKLGIKPKRESIEAMRIKDKVTKNIKSKDIIDLSLIGENTALKLNNELSNEFKIVLNKYKIKSERGIFKVSKTEEE